MFVEVALRLGLAAALGATVIGLGTLLMRAVTHHRQQRTQWVERAWRPVLTEAMLGIEPAHLPDLAPSDRSALLHLWIYFQESVRGESKDQLNRLAVRMGLDAQCRRHLKRGNRGQRLAALLALGHLGTADDWTMLHRTLQDRDPMVSQLAARALVQIDPQQAVAAWMPLILSRSDWDITSLASVLRSAAVHVTAEIDRQWDGWDPDRQAGAMTLAAALKVRLMPQRLIALLEDVGAPDSLVRLALPLVQEEPRALPAIRRHARAAPEPGIRAQAVQALGHLGQAEDVAFLIGLLDDSDWRVRSASANALWLMPALGIPRFQQLMHAEDRPRALQALHGVWFEHERTLSR